MSDAKTVEAQFTDRINELAKKVAPMAEVLEAVAERDNELGKTKEEKDKKWKEILGVIEDVKGLKGDFEEMQTAIAERKISFASDALPEKRSKRAILHDTARYSLGLIRASKWGGNDPTYLNTVVEQISKAGPLTSGTATGGAEFVPTILASEIYMLLEDEGEAMGLCTPIPMESMTEKVADPGSVIVTWQSVLGGEGTAATDQAPTTGDADLAADTLIATMGLTNQLLKTSKVDLVQVYTTRFIRRMTREWESQILQGSGTPFTGISDVSGANEIVLDATKTKPEDVTFENIADLVGDLSKEALRGAEWWLHPGEISVLRNVRGDDGQPVFCPPGGEMASTIYGIPYRTSFDMIGPTGSAQASKVFIELGNLSNALLGKVEDLRFDVSQDVAFRQYMAVLRAVMVGGFVIPDATAFGRIKTAAA